MASILIMLITITHCDKLSGLPVPPLGLNTWYAFGTQKSFARTTEGNVMAVAKFMKSSGLRDLGYKFLVVDDGWSSGVRGARGLEANNTKFPSGMGVVAARVRDLGLNLGLYTTPGKYTCSGQSGGGERGSGGYEVEDVRKWVGEWGIGWIKDCVCNSTQQDRQQAYHKVRGALDELASSAVLECANYMDSPWRRDETTGRVSALDCDVYTVSDDVPDDFESWNLIVDLTEAQRSRFVEGTGARSPVWPSFDYLRVGGSQSESQYRAQVGFMAIAPAPLFIGSELKIEHGIASLPSSVLQTYSTKLVLDIHQDALGAKGKRAHHDATGHNGAFMDIYVRSLSGSRVALLLLNRSGKSEAFSVDTGSLGAGFDMPNGLVVVTDAWTGRKTNLVDRVFLWTVEATGSALLVLSHEASRSPVTV